MRTAKNLLFFILIIAIMDMAAVPRKQADIIETFFKRHVRTYVSTSIPNGAEKFMKGKRPEWCFNIRQKPIMVFHQTLRSNQGSLSYSDFKKFVDSSGPYGPQNLARAIDSLPIRTTIRTKSTAQIRNIRLRYYEIETRDDQDLGDVILQKPKEVLLRDFEVKGTDFSFDFQFSPQLGDKGGSGLTLIARVDILSLADNLTKPNIGCIAEISSTIPDQK